MTKLPSLVDCKQLMDELGVKRNVAEKIMRELPKVTVADVRKVYVRRDDVAQYLESRTQAA